MKIEIKDCDTIVDGYHYTTGRKWLYLYRGATKKYRLLLDDEVVGIVGLLTIKNTGANRTLIVKDYIMEHGEEV